MFKVLVTLLFFAVLTPLAGARDLASPGLKFSHLSGWTIEHPSPDRTLLKSKDSKANVLIVEYVTTVSRDEARAFFASGFKKEIIEDRLGGWDLEGTIAQDAVVRASERRGLSFGEMSFTIDYGETRAGLTERLFVSGDRVWQIIDSEFGSYSVDPEGQRIVVDQVMDGLLEATKSQGASAWIDFLIPRAYANEAGTSRPGSARRAARPGAAAGSASWNVKESNNVKQNAFCKSLNIKPEDASTSGYGLHVDSSSAAACWNGVKGQAKSMERVCEAVVIGGYHMAVNAFGNAGRSPVRVARARTGPDPCGEIPRHATSASFASFVGARSSYEVCEKMHNAIGTTHEIITSTYSGAKSAYSWVSTHVHPIVMIQDFLKNSIAGFGCFNARAQAEMFCKFVTVVAAVAITSAVGGAGLAAVRGAASAEAALSSEMIVQAGLKAAARQSLAMITPMGSGLARSGAKMAGEKMFAREVASTAESAASKAAKLEAKKLAAKQAAKTGVKAGAKVGAKAGVKKEVAAVEGGSSSTSGVSRSSKSSYFAHGQFTSRLSPHDAELYEQAVTKHPTLLDRANHGIAMQTPSDATVTVMLRDAFGTEKQKTMTMHELVQEASAPRPSFDSIEFVGVKTTAKPLSAAAAAKIEPGVASNSHEILSAQVHFKSGEVGRFTGTPEQLHVLAEESDVASIKKGSASLIAPDVSRISPQMRAASNDAVAARMKMLPKDVVQHSQTMDLSGMKIYHGTVNQFEDSVRAGPQNIGKGYGGAGLYLALGHEDDLADTYAKYAMKQYEDRIAEHGIKANHSLPVKPVVMEGTINPKKNLVVGVFQVRRDATTDLSKGILGGSDWMDDPLVKKALEENFDVLDLRGAASSGVPGLSDRFLVVHKRAGHDAIIWKPSHSLRGESR